MSAIDELISVCKSDLDDEMLDLAFEAERELARLRAIEKAENSARKKYAALLQRDAFMSVRVIDVVRDLEVPGDKP